MMYAHRLVTERGFINEFWRQYLEMSAKDPSVTQEMVYDILNEEYRSVFGEDRFKSFDAFRKKRDKKK